MPQLIAVLVEDLYQDLEVWYPIYRFREAGLKVLAVGNGKPAYTGKYGTSDQADKQISEVNPKDFAAVIIPGGWAPEKLRMSKPLLHFVRAMHEQGKVVASICHGGWVLASAEIVKGKRVTSYEAIRDDLCHAGANFVDEEVVQDGNLITSRKPDDLPAFCRTILAALSVPA